MVTTLKKAIAELASLPDSDQEEIGRKLLSHVELQKLRADIVQDSVRSTPAKASRSMSRSSSIR